MNKPSLSFRLLLIALAIFSLFVLLFFQFFKIQIMQHDLWEKIAKKQHFFAIKEPYVRGCFYSNTSLRKGHPESAQPFVINVETFKLHIDPEAIPIDLKNDMSQEVIGLIGECDKEKCVESFFKKSRNRKLCSGLPLEKKEAVLAWWKGYARENKIAKNALFFTSEHERFYPFGSLLGQVLHTLQDCGDSIDPIPTGGLELYFNEELKGKGGKRLLKRSPRNSYETGDVIASPIHGADIHLTVNHCLQAIAEEELERGVLRTNAKAGWAIMMDPFSGEILAMAQYPFFNPTDLSSYFNDPRKIEDTKLKALTDANEPGSIMKPLTLTLALLANIELKKRGEPPLFDPKEMMPTSNSKFTGRSKPLVDTHLHYFLNMNMALQKSSNIYVARLVEKVIQRLGTEWYRSTIQGAFGLNRKTGIEFPSEARGVLPMPGKKHPNGTLEWSISTPYSLAFGHNIQTTSLQIVRAYAVLANGGYLVAPTFLRKITKKNEEGGEIIIKDFTDPSRVSSFPQVLNKEIAEQVVTAMKYTTKLGGSGKRGDVPGFTEGGKTGTAKKIINGQYSENKYVATFVGFTPIESPKFVLLVAMDEPQYGFIPGIGKMHHGGYACAPVFREIARRSLEYLGVSPDDPYGYPVGDPRYNAEKANWVKEAQLLQLLYEQWNHPKKN